MNVLERNKDTKKQARYIIPIEETKRFTKWERSDYAKKKCRTDESYY